MLQGLPPPVPAEPKPREPGAKPAGGAKPRRKKARKDDDLSDEGPDVEEAYAAGSK